MSDINPLNYIHTYDISEQRRLLKQAELLESLMYKRLDFSSCSNLLEVGCGVGAQLRLMVKRYPHLHITGVDVSEEQLSMARKVLADELSRSVVSLERAEGTKLPFQDNSFDAIVFFFVLEHVSSPEKILSEALRVLRPGGMAVCTEVFNDGLCIYPEDALLMEYWKAFNELQKEFGGHPNIGIHLPNLMHNVGFKDINLHEASHCVDRRMSSMDQRREYVDLWRRIFASAEDTLISRGKFDSSIKKKFDEKFSALYEDMSSILYYNNRQAIAFK